MTPLARRRIYRAAFYASVALLLLAIVTRQLALVLPDGLAVQIGHNSEAFAFALMACALLEWARTTSSPHALSLGAVLALLLVACALFLKQAASLPSSLVTLNEPLLAAAGLAVYVQLRRPLRAPQVYSLALLAVIVVFFDTGFVLDQAEALVPLVLAPIALDVVDRWILDPTRPDSPRRLGAWMLTLAGLGLVVMLLAPWARDDLSSPVPLAIDYAHRASEAYWGWVLVHLYFAFLPGRSAQRGESTRTQLPHQHRLPRREGTPS